MFAPPPGGPTFCYTANIKKNSQSSKCTYLPIDAEFYADFKNVYFYAIILNI